MDAAVPPETTAPAPMTRSDLLKRLAGIKDDIESHKEWMNAEFELVLMMKRNVGPNYAVFCDEEEVAGCSEEHIGQKLLVAERRSHRRYCREYIAALQEERKLLRLRLDAMPTEAKHG